MAQESWKMNSNEMGCQPPEGPVLCSNNCGFFGSPTTMNLCSQCYGDALRKQAEVAEVTAAISAVQLEPSIEDASASADKDIGCARKLAAVSSSSVPSSDELPRKINRCGSCNKRVGLAGFKCRCGGLFCSLHRYSDKHDCSFDYKSTAQDSIRKANPVIKADKIEKI